MAKTIKYLSDGAIAKVGMIVAHKDPYDKRKTICKIIALTDSETSDIRDPKWLTTDLRTGGGYNYKWSTNCKNLRKATSEERKRYYQQLYSNQNG